MALITAIAGPYTAVHSIKGGVPFALVGVAREGFHLSWSTHEHEIRKTTSFASSLIESIYLGADWGIQMHLREYARQGFLDIVWPWGARNDSALAPSMGPTFPVKMGRAGRRATDNAGILLLTSTLATPAVASPATLTANFAILRQGGGSSLNFDSTLRESPVTMNLLPYDYTNGDFDGGMMHIWFLTT